MTDKTFDENPWSAEYWNLTRQGEYIKKYGLEVAKTKAKQARAKIGDLAPRIGPDNGRYTVIVQHKGLTAPVGGGGLVGAGSSGTGEPT